MIRYNTKSLLQNLKLMIPIYPGFIVLHSNRLEALRDTVLSWLRDHPLNPLEPETFLVQSNGIAEWLKISLAQQDGICAAVSVDLPGRFLWNAYGQMLGRDKVLAVSPLDKNPLTWRLMRLLPTALEDSAFEPLQQFLADGDLERRWQLASRLADIFDQYQVYRSDWLNDWAEQRLQLRAADGTAYPLLPEQIWQAELWQRLLTDLHQYQQKATGRAQIHHAFVDALEAAKEPNTPLPRRVILFGASVLPGQTLEALAALATRCQVILAVPNPCRFHWADIMDGREILRIERQRHSLRENRNLASLSLEELHLHSNPLLASWGRQGRDFVRLLDRFDDAVTTKARLEIPRIDVYEEDTGSTLLQQIQSRVRDLEPLQRDHPTPLAPGDQSVVFHIAHSAQREVEILHDQLLALLAASDDETPLAPRNIVVMVPDIQPFAPIIRAVFDQYDRHDDRHIPYEIVDLRARAVNPMLIALEWLLHLPEQRCRLGEIRDLLDCSAFRSRLGLEEADLAQCSQWLEGAGVRWGLSVSHRDQLGLGACADQNTWKFGLQRMFLGYAAGPDLRLGNIESYGEIGGLDASLVGPLSRLLARLDHWRKILSEEASPAEWIARARQVLADFFDNSAETDRLTQVALETALSTWFTTCDNAQFVEAIPLTVFREAWLEALDEPSLNQTFLAGGVTFCTLMPMRSVPFDVVCLLGMNDGDYPRRSPRADFDLMGSPKQYRPGDRSRRDDDRYLMLEALLSARRTLYISWAGRDIRNNRERPPSVLVAQLRDYIAAGWATEGLKTLTTEHPLQPFSARYFQQGGHWLTYTREWREAHRPLEITSENLLPPFIPDADIALTVARLVEFLRNPVRYFFRHRLGVVFDTQEEALADDESFGLDGLTRHQRIQELLEVAPQLFDTPERPAATLVEERAARIQRSGVLPMASFGAQTREELVRTAVPMLEQWKNLRIQWAVEAPKQLLRFVHGGFVLEDWLDGLYQQADDLAWLELSPSRLCAKDATPRADKMLTTWIRHLLASASGVKVKGILAGQDAILETGGISPAEAEVCLSALIDAWHEGMQTPLPVACQTAFAFVQEKNPRAQYEGSYQQDGEGQEPCLHRSFPNFAALNSTFVGATDRDFSYYANALYRPLADWVRSTAITIQLHPNTADNP